jgi:hypothetical protein
MRASCYSSNRQGEEGGGGGTERWLLSKNLITACSRLGEGSLLDENDFEDIWVMVFFFFSRTRLRYFIGSSEARRVVNWV